jgi:chaperonin GroES
VAKSKKKPVAKKPVVKKSPAKKPAAKKAPAKKAPAKKAAVKKPVAKKAAPVKKAVMKKPAAPKAAAPKVAVKSSAPVKMTAATSFAAKPVKKFDMSKLVTPLDDRVLIQPAEGEKMTAGGLYIPDTATSVAGNSRGIVVAVGRGRRDKKGRMHPMDLKVGDNVVFTEYSGIQIKIQDQDLMIVRESDVLGVIGSNSK